MGETLWTPFRLNLLRDLHAIGLSCTKIAGKLGGGISTTQVIEKALALKLAIRERLPEDLSEPKFRTPRPAHVNQITLPGLKRA